MAATPTSTGVPAESSLDPREPTSVLLRDLATTRSGLRSVEAQRRLARYGPNVLSTRRRRQWPKALARQFTHPLALLLLLAAALASVSGTPNLAWAVLAVVVLNAVFAFVQEQQAGRAVEALGRYLPPRSRVRRDDRVVEIAAENIVPGDVLLISEGDRLPADARLLTGAVVVDAAALTGESIPVQRLADAVDTAARRLDSPVLVFSGTACVGGEAEAVVHATGAHTEIGRIAAMSSHRVSTDSPLERQVRRVAYLIAGVAIVVGAAFLPLGMLAGLSLTSAFLFAVGLIVANVPEGLLPTITLALAAGVRAMAKRGAVVKRLSSVETLGSTTVVCTDKTGTLTTGAMRVQEIRDADGVAQPGPSHALAQAVALCSTSDLDNGSGDPTELALLAMARCAGVTVDSHDRATHRRALYAFDPRRKTMATLDHLEDLDRIHVKGAPEVLLPHCESAGDRVRVAVEDMTGRGLRVLAVASRSWTGVVPPQRDEAEGPGLRLLGLVGLLDPPRPEAAGAVAACHAAGITIHVVTGDNGRTAAEIARQIGITADQVIDGDQLDALSDESLGAVLAAPSEIIFSRAAPEAKLRIADLLRAQHEVVAMTGDGVNDAPALHHADIGVAMGRSGTEVAREAAAMVLTDDNFATVVAGIEEGRRVYDNVRKFVLYIFAHAVPEVLPYLAFALLGGLLPLPLTVLQVLAIDLGTEILPALALGRERAEPGLMHRPPRSATSRVIDRRMLLRAWALMGTVSAVLGMGLFLVVLHRSGWTLGAQTGPGSPLHRGYLQATTASFAAIVACQIGTAFAARTQFTSLRRIGILSNRLLLAAIGVEILFAGAVIYLPSMQTIFDTAALPGWALVALLPMPIIVWGVDELYRYWTREHRLRPEQPAPAGNR